jgi:hypothetical protein
MSRNLACIRQSFGTRSQPGRASRPRPACSWAAPAANQPGLHASARRQRLTSNLASKLRAAGGTVRTVAPKV